MSVSKLPLKSRLPLAHKRFLLISIANLLWLKKNLIQVAISFTIRLDAFSGNPYCSASFGAEHKDVPDESRNEDVSKDADGFCFPPDGKSLLSSFLQTSRLTSVSIPTAVVKTQRQLNTAHPIKRQLKHTSGQLNIRSQSPRKWLESFAPLGPAASGHFFLRLVS
ncbi:hypothetical protein Mal52_52380 [Symmachiella dynata]|uniref:Uncharacterized protein n=1 Tax=Symmachiella dynata TaxID=2527995 RepID=A0A517ZW86_9PLAN|nr:hypothetical protein Mal52_52380 [Symmachiella dynata]